MLAHYMVCVSYYLQAKSFLLFGNFGLITNEENSKTDDLLVLGSRLSICFKLMNSMHFVGHCTSTTPSNSEEKWFRAVETLSNIYTLPACE